MLTLPLRFVWRERDTIGVGRIVISIPDFTSKIDMGHDRMKWGEIVEHRQNGFDHSTVIAYKSARKLFKVGQFTDIGGTTFLRHSEDQGQDHGW
jgi:hypothetical protein